MLLLYYYTRLRYRHIAWNEITENQLEVTQGIRTSLDILIFVTSLLPLRSFLVEIVQRDLITGRTVSIILRHRRKMIRRFCTCSCCQVDLHRGCLAVFVA